MTARSMVQVRRLEDEVLDEGRSVEEVGRERNARESVIQPSAMWAMAMRQAETRDLRALQTLRWVALVVLPPMVQTMANYCQYRIDGGHDACVSRLHVDPSSILCDNSGPLDGANLFWNSFFHGFTVLPAVVPTWLCGWNRLGRLTIMSLTTFVIVSKLTGSGLLDPRGLVAMLRVLGWQIATTEFLLPARQRP